MAVISKDWFPKKDAEEKAFYENFKIRIAEEGPRLGYTEAQILAIQRHCTDAIAKYDEAATAKDEYDGKIAAKESFLTDLLRDEIRPLVAEIKTNPACTPEMEELLRIVGESIPFNPDEYVAEATANAKDNTVTIRFKKGKANAVNVYGKEKGEPEFELLGTDMNSPYVHEPELTDGKPETWEYYVIGVYKDKEIGTRSDVMVVQVGRA